MVSHGPRGGRSLTLPPERGRSPPAARRSVELVWSIPEPFHPLCCCGPGLRRAEVASATQAGRSAVRRWRVLDAPTRPGPSWSLPSERGRSPPAARCSVELVWSNPEPFHQLSCCGPGLRRAEVASATQAGRSAVRRWRFQCASQCSLTLHSLTLQLRPSATWRTVPEASHEHATWFHPH